MKTTRITSYDPTESVEYNAAINNVKVSTMRAYIKSRGIDRATDKQICLYKKVKDYADEHPHQKAPEIALALGLSANTVRKYMRMREPPKPIEKKVSVVDKAQRIQFLSVSENQSDILRSIIAIHLGGWQTFQCDLTAWKCGFYKDGIPRALWLYDKYPQLPEVRPLSEIVEVSDGFFRSIIIDLPTTVEEPNTKTRFDVSSMFSSMEELYQEHKKMLELAYRLAQTDGIIVYKTMDFTYYNTPHWISDYVLSIAYFLGLKLVDKYIYIDPKHTKIDRRRTRYTASIPSHAYFFVFRKVREDLYDDRINIEDDRINPHL